MNGHPMCAIIEYLHSSKVCPNQICMLILYVRSSNVCGHPIYAVLPCVSHPMSGVIQSAWLYNVCGHSMCMVVQCV